MKEKKMEEKKERKKKQEKEEIISYQEVEEEVITITTLPNKTTNFNHYNTELSFKIKFSFKPQLLLLDILELTLSKF